MLTSYFRACLPHECTILEINESSLKHSDGKSLQASLELTAREMQRGKWFYLDLYKALAVGSAKMIDMEIRNGFLPIISSKLINDPKLNL